MDITERVSGSLVQPRDFKQEAINAPNQVTRKSLVRKAVDAYRTVGML